MPKWKIVAIIFFMLFSILDFYFRISHFSANLFASIFSGLESLFILLLFGYLLLRYAFFSVSIIIVLLIYAIDIFLIFFLNTGITLSHLPVAYSIVTSGEYISDYALMFTMIAIALLLLFIFLYQGIQDLDLKNFRKVKYYTLLIMIASFLLIFFFNQSSILPSMWKVTFVDDPLLRLISDLYSSAYKKNILANIDDINPLISIVYNESGADLDKNLILLVVESMSSSDSFKASSINNYFPRLDKTFHSGVLYPLAIANGGTSDEGHIALLQGIEPIFKPNSLVRNYHSFSGFLSPLPDFFNKKGYNTFFITSTSLDFLGMGNYMKSLGFQNVIGKLSFPDATMYTQNSPADEVIYDEIIDTLEHTNAPIFITAHTASSHLPYNTPYGETMEDTYKYVDDTLSNFIAKLYENNYFNSGVLILIGDHRRMTPITSLEFTKYGRLSYNTTIAAVFGINEDQIIPSIIDQTDIYYSIISSRSKNIQSPRKFNNILSQSFIKNWSIFPVYGTKGSFHVFVGDILSGHVETYDINNISNTSGELKEYLHKRLSNLNIYRNSSQYRQFVSSWQ